MLRIFSLAFLLAIAIQMPAGAQKSSLKKTSNYGDNILSLAVLQATTEGVPAFGIHYERILDKKKLIAFYLPVAFTFAQHDNYNYNNPQGTINDNRRDLFISAFPGIKIYPTGANGVVRYSVGPSLGIVSGKRNFNVYDGLTGNYNVSRENVFKLGLIVNNGINIQPSEHLYLGIEFGLGFYYLNDERNRYANYNNYNDLVPMIQGNFKMGYRF